jgi:hypothetical protein
MANTTQTGTQRSGKQGVGQQSVGQQGGARASAQSTGASEGAPDHLYGVVSVLYHALQGAQTYQQYIDDARKASVPAVEDFFTSCQKEERLRAERAKELLLDLLEDEEQDEDETSDEDEDEDEDEDA